jgi:hypothetical protein
MIVISFSIGFGVSSSVSADSSSPSGTSIPVKKGGTGAVDKTNALKNLLPDLAGNDGKALGLVSGEPTWMNGLALPNYSAADGGKVLEVDSGGALTWTTPPTTTYSTTEQLTGEIWIDGKPIYQRVFTGTISAAAGNTITSLLPDGTVSTLVSDQVRADLGDGWVTTGNNSSGSNFGCEIWWDKSTVSPPAGRGLGSVEMRAWSTAIKTNASYYVVLEYTKL